MDPPELTDSTPLYFGSHVLLTLALLFYSLFPMPMFPKKKKIKEKQHFWSRHYTEPSYWIWPVCITTVNDLIGQLNANQEVM